MGRQSYAIKQRTIENPQGRQYWPYWAGSAAVLLIKNNDNETLSRAFKTHKQSIFSKVSNNSLLPCWLIVIVSKSFVFN